RSKTHVFTPASFAFLARRRPTSAACSDLSPFDDSRTASHDAAAIVRPPRSSTSCASMPRFDRCTTRRGRSAVPWMRPRTRRWRRSRAVRTVDLGTLPHLSADVLALVADALALVGLGRTDLANLCGRLADDLLIGALHDDLGRCGHVE